MRSNRKSVWFPTLLAVLGAGFASTRAAAYSSGPTNADGRVIVLGFDGADARTTRAMMDQGMLPNLTRLAEMGTFAPLRSTNPAESAAGWAALNTGVNPIENGVASFIIRDLSGGAPMPNMGHIEIGSRAVEDFEHSGLMKILVEYRGPKLVVGTGVLVLIGFLIVFAALLRVKLSLAVPLALGLAGVGAWGAAKASEYVPNEIAGVFKNRVKADGVWDHAARQGVQSIVLDAALAFDRPTVEGARVLGGLGLPDARGSISGMWFTYTTDDLEMEKTPHGRVTSTGAGRIFRVNERNGKIVSELYGPVNFWELDRLDQELAEVEELRANPDLGWKRSNELRDQKTEIGKRRDELRDEHVSLPVVVEILDGKARVTLGSQTQEIAEGEWSDWYRLSFQINPLIKARAVTRAKIVSLDDPVHGFVMLVNNLEIDPTSPPFWQPLSQPPSFSGELAEWIQEPYETTGWSCMTNAMKDEEVDPQTFLEDIEFTMGWREKLTYAALERGDWRLLFSVFSSPDRVQHIMYKYYDEGHPRYKEAEAAKVVTFFGQELPLAEVIPEIYRQMDRIVGRVMDDYVGPDDTLLLCADHGFTSYRRGMHVNNWLAQKGYLVLRDRVKRSDGRRLAAYPDWSRTKAYALGLGMVFLNLEGREPHGIVKLEDAEGVLQAIADDFLAATDTGEDGKVDGEVRINPAYLGTKVGHDAVIMKDLYDGPWGTEEYFCADLMLGFEENYRASWSTVTGRIRLEQDGSLGATFESNSNPWSGDHASVSPAIVQGIFFSNRPVEVPEDGVSVLHMAPTILSRLGLDVPETLDRAPLSFR